MKPRAFHFHRDESKHPDDWWYSNRKYRSGVSYDNNRYPLSLCPSGVSYHLGVPKDAKKMTIEVTDFDREVSNCFHCQIASRARYQPNRVIPTFIRIENPKNFSGWSRRELCDGTYHYLYKMLGHVYNEGPTDFWVTVNWS